MGMLLVQVENKRKKEPIHAGTITKHNIYFKQSFSTISRENSEILKQ